MATSCARRRPAPSALVYDAIRRVNREVGELLSDQFENLENGSVVAKVLDEKPPST